MAEESGTAWTPDYPGIGWGLQLTVRRRQRMPGGLLLRGMAPFMALGGRWPQAAGTLSLPAALPWLTPRWLERPDEPVSRTAAAVVPTAAPLAAPGSGQPQAQPPVALALAFQTLGAGPGKAGCQILPGAGRAEVVSRARAGTGAVTGPGAIAVAGLPQSRQLQSLPYHAGAARPAGNLSAPDTGTVPGPGVAGSGTGFPLVSNRLREAEPPRVPVPGSLQGAVPPELPVSGRRQRTMPQGLPVPGRLRGLMPLRFSHTPPAWGFPGALHGLGPDTTSLREYQGVSGIGDTPGNTLYDTTAPGPVPLQGLGLVMEVISRTVKREVAEVVKKREEEARPYALAPAHRPGMPGMPEIPAPEVPVSDSVVRLYMQKMRKLAEEERFRLGLLR